MAAWGPGVFNDDCARDCFTDLCESESIEYISNALEDAVESTYLDYETSCAAVVSAAVIDAILNEENHDPDNEEFMLWVRQNRKLPVSPLKPLAIKALGRVLSDDSELYEQWMENEDGFREWKSGVDNIINRLSE